jgi:hypothetical protein
MITISLLMNVIGACSTTLPQEKWSASRLDACKTADSSIKDAWFLGAHMITEQKISLSLTSTYTGDKQTLWMVLQVWVAV